MPGVEADVSVLADEVGRFRLQDNEDTQVVAITSSARCSVCAAAGVSMPTP
jgi:hypothetical protein